LIIVHFGTLCYRKQRVQVHFALDFYCQRCGRGLTVPVILEDVTIDGERYIREVLPAALKCGNNMLGNNWTYQQDGARPHIHRLSQKWCADHFPAFISKERWPPNSPDLCAFDYSLWNELAQSMDWSSITTKATFDRRNKTFCQKN